MVGVNVLHHVKKRRNCPGGGMCGGDTSGEYVQGKCPDPELFYTHCAKTASRSRHSGIET